MPRALEPHTGWERHRRKSCWRPVLLSRPSGPGGGRGGVLQWRGARQQSRAKLTTRYLVRIFSVWRTVICVCWRILPCRRAGGVVADAWGVPLRAAAPLLRLLHVVRQPSRPQMRLQAGGGGGDWQPVLRCSGELPPQLLCHRSTLQVAGHDVCEDPTKRRYGAAAARRQPR